MTTISGAEDGGGAHRIHEALRLGGHAGVQPVFQADQRHVEAVAVAGEQARGIEHLLENLVIAGEPDIVIETQQPGPERQSGLDSFSGKGGGDGDRAIVDGHSFSIMKFTECLSQLIDWTREELECRR